MLVLTKSDLMDKCDDPVTVDEIEEKAREMGFSGFAVTSSKEW